MGLLESSKKLFEQTFYVALVFSLVFTILNAAMYYSTGLSFAKSDTNPDGIPIMTWGLDLLNSAINAFKQGVGINLIVAIPMFAGAILSIILQILANTITLSHYLINLSVQLFLKFVILEPTSIETISNILAWVLEAPIILGMGTTIGNIIFMFWPGGVQS
ncbi:MAG: hypothetical protein ACTSPB_21120 [Candidatus Thorarchaeota archaeon]